MRCELENGRLACGGVVIMDQVSAEVSLVECGAGVILRVRIPGQGYAVVNLGRPRVERFTACYRYEPFWMRPAMGRRVAEVPAETQFLLAELADGRVAVVVPLAGGLMRCALQGNEDDRLMLTTDAGTVQATSDYADAVYIAVGRDPFEVCRQAAEEIALEVTKPRPMPAFAEGLGWCTWDAFYQDVSEEKVLAGLASLHAAGIRPRFLILDDGWQETRDCGAERGVRLASFRANAKFPRGLAHTIERAKREFGIERFLVWHALQGYWGGVDVEAFRGFEAREVERRFSPGVLVHWPEGNTKPWGRRAGIVTPAHWPAFMRAFFEYLQAQGVDGVKIDNQATNGAFDHALGPRVSTARAMMSFLDAQAAAHFQGNVLHSMACSNELMMQPRCGTTRTSGDYYPDRPASHGQHLVSNAHVGLFFGQFAHADWDMFQSGHPWGWFHAAARAISGGPIYLSDRPGQHDAALVRALVMQDGSVLRCDRPAVPTADCLFTDPTRENVLLKIWNTNNAGRAGVVGIFHCRHGHGAITGAVSPADVAAAQAERYVAHSFHRGLLGVMGRAEKFSLTLEEAGWDVLTIVPCESGSCCVIGLEGKLNPRAALTEEVHSQNESTLRLKEGGTLALYSEQTPTRILVNEALVPFMRIGNLLRVDLPAAVEPMVRIFW